MMESFYLYMMGMVIGIAQGFSIAKFLEERKRLKTDGKARRLSKRD